MPPKRALPGAMRPPPAFVAAYSPLLAVWRLLFDWSCFGSLSAAVLIAEAALCAAIVLRVPCACVPRWARRPSLRHACCLRHKALLRSRGEFSPQRRRGLRLG